MPNMATLEPPSRLFERERETFSKIYDLICWHSLRLGVAEFENRSIIGGVVSVVTYGMHEMKCMDTRNEGGQAQMDSSALFWAVQGTLSIEGFFENADEPAAPGQRPVGVRGVSERRRLFGTAVVQL